jgi:hypothetical protein
MGQSRSSGENVPRLARSDAGRCLGPLRIVPQRPSKAKGSPRLDHSPVARLPIPSLLEIFGILQGGSRLPETESLAEPLLRATDRARGRLVVKLGGDALPSDRAG